MEKRTIICLHCGAKGSLSKSQFGEGVTLSLRCPKCGKVFEVPTERRSAARRIPLPMVKIGSFGFMGDVMNKRGVLQDISLTGMRVSVGSLPPEMNERLNFRFHLPGTAEEVRVGGEVVWVHRMEKNEYEFGVEFITLDQHNRKIIGFYLFQDEGEEVLEMEHNPN